MTWQTPSTDEVLSEYETARLLNQSDEEITSVVEWQPRRPSATSLSSCFSLARRRQRCLATKARLVLRSFWLLTLFLLAFVFISLANGILRPSYSDLPAHYLALNNRISSSRQRGRGNLGNEKVFIAANIIDEGLIRGTWGHALQQTVELLGDDNVFVSIYENDSGNGTSEALRSLQQQLRCNTSVVTGAHLSLDIFDKMTLPNGDRRVSRIEYLAEVRNQLLRPLDAKFSDDPKTGFRSAADVQFDKILFLNDVYFNPVDAMQLLFSTNAPDGVAEYRAACAIDFVRGAQMYDTFVVRDTDGFSSGFMFYPWFAASGSQVSRSSVLQQSDAVPVRSCWGGMVAFDASLFQTRDAAAIWSTSQDYELLHFRSSREEFWEAAECCLVFADIEEQHGPAIPDEGSGVFINPYIRTAYSASTWQWMPRIQRFERCFQYLQWCISKLIYPGQNERRLHEAGDMVNETVWMPDMAGNGQFKTIQRPARAGGFCGQRKLFVMKDDLASANTDGTGKNWENVPVPALELRDNS